MKNRNLTNGLGAKKISKTAYRPSFDIVNGANIATLYIYDEIGKSWWDDSGITDNDVINELKKAGGKPLEVRINSDGGNVFEGIAIYNALRRYENTVTIYIDGIAASIASVIACASKYVYIGRGASFMVHEPSTGAWGSKADLQKAINALDACKESILDIYVEKTGLDRNELSDLMLAETWFTSTEAISKGFAVSEIDLPTNHQNRLAESFKNLRIRQPSNVHVEAVYNRLFHAINSITPATTPALSTDTTDTKGDDMRNNLTTPAKPEIDEQAIKNQAQKEAREFEAKRQSGIKNLFEGFPEHADLREACIDDFDCDLANAQSQLITAMKTAPKIPVSNQTPLSNVTHVSVIDNSGEHKDLMVNALLNRASVHNAAPVDSHNPYKNSGLHALMRQHLANQGINTNSMSNTELVAKAIEFKNLGQTSADFSVVVGDFVYRALIAAIALAPQTWRKISAIKPLSDFRVHEDISAAGLGKMGRKDANGEYEIKKLADGYKGSTKAEERGSIFQISRVTLINDDLGVIADAIRDLGLSLGITLETEVWEYLISNPLMPNGKRLFSADHGNILPASEMNAKMWLDARAMMVRQKAFGGNDRAYLSMRPKLLCCPLDDFGTAKTLNGTVSAFTGGTTTNVATSGMLSEIIDTPYIDGVGSYFFDPLYPILNVGFLDGVELPQVYEHVDFKSADLQYRIMSDHGYGTRSPYGAVFAPAL